MNFSDAVYQFISTGEGTPPTSVPGILARILPLTIPVFVGLSLCLGVCAALRRAWRSKHRPAAGLDEGARQREATSVIAAGICLANLMVLASCALGWTAVRAIQAHTGAYQEAVYKNFHEKFAIAGVFQGASIMATLMWRHAKMTENTVWYVIIPAVYRTLLDSMETEETVDHVFSVICPIFDRYIMGLEWEALIMMARKSPELDGAKYLELMLNVVYAKDKKGRSPYTYLFSQSEQAAIDIIKVDVFHYPAYDTPWKLTN